MSSVCDLVLREMRDIVINRKVADIAVVAGIGRRIPVFAIAPLKHSQHVKRFKFKSHARARVGVVNV